MTVHALIVAAGKGIRAGGGTPKQYRTVAGKPLLRHAVEGLLAHPRIDAVTVIINPDDQTLYHTAVAGLALPPPV
ncbi:2-C-methyl-D-erythritol 4-phosphate cytidylyltransferase, partial [Thiocapsa sp.]|uniref:IspD/TarI family cytidylyltransferase n=1 Tax=Thiocapsa sp. TaxID=2024551 RepID=UPI00359467B8